MMLGDCGSPQGTAFWRDHPQLQEDASVPAVGIGHLQIFSCPGCTRSVPASLGRIWEAKAFQDMQGKCPSSTLVEVYSRKQRGYGCASVLTEKR